MRNSYTRFLYFTGFALGLGLSVSCQEAPTNQMQTTKPSQLKKQTDQSKVPLIVFMGDSLTAGYGLDVNQAYPALIEKKIKSEGLSFRVLNAAASGATSSDGLGQVDWNLEMKPAVLVLALGANDGLRGLNPDVTKKNLNAIILKAKTKIPTIKILLAGMKAPPNMGEDYFKKFSSLFNEVAQKNKVAFLPFLLDGVAANPDMNLADGIHPNEQGHVVMTKLVWNKLLPLLKN